jgi:hypothetical protein
MFPLNNFINFRYSEGDIMSHSNEWTDWHLTPRGWERGSTRVDGAGVTEKAIPGDRVLTKRWAEEKPSSFGGMSKELEDKWESDDKAAIEALIDKFGKCPEPL